MSKSRRNQQKFLSAFIATALSFGLFLYFAYHLAHGDRGYFALKGVETKLVENNTRYERLRHDREILENKVKLLRPETIDTDLLDERARVVLGFIGKNEKVLIP